MVRSFEKEVVAKGLVEPQLLQRLAKQNEHSSLIYALFEENLVDEAKFLDFYKDFLGIKSVNFKSLRYDDSLIDHADGNLWRSCLAFPIKKAAHKITVAMVDPYDYEAIENIEDQLGLKVNPVLAAYSEIVGELDDRFGVVSSVKNIMDNLDTVGLQDVFIGTMENEVFQSNSQSGPISKLLHLVISHALKENASDIHFEPTERELQCRFRIDGVLSRFMAFPKHLSNSWISSIKVLAKMDIAEKRLPLDGGFQVRVGNKIIDLRVSSFPILDGEKIVIRILDKSSMRFSLDGLGMSTQMLEQFLPVINRNSGIVLVTGPTGSGKTTTLYAVLDRIKSIEKNIVTIEDPIEYHLPMINQSQVNVKAGLTFARGLRSFLRQDPDVLLVGEVRDFETAEISFQAALTGHLVFTTLHTNDAASSITRLRDMGVENYLLSSSITAVLAQRLARRVCRNCLEEYTPEPQSLAWLGLKADGSTKFLRGAGCDNCKNSGYKGRVGIYELLIPDEDINQLVHEHSVNADDIRKVALNKGMISLRLDAIDKVLRGLTTAEEVFRVLR